MSENIYNCMLFAAGKNATATGRVLVAHNEDDGGYMVVRHGYVPAADWSEDAVLPAEPGCAAIPQVPHTLGFYWSEVRNPERGMSNADTFYNECGVLVTSDNCAHSREDVEDASRLTEGGISFNLRRIAAERAHSAREAIGILIELVEKYGYAPSGRAYTVADKDELFMIQIVSGKHYVAARVPDDMAVVMPNHYTFHRLDEFEEMYYPKDIITYAMDKGWYVPAVSGCYDDFDFARAYQAEGSWMGPVNVNRQRLGLQRVTGEHWEPDMEKGMPFAVRPNRKLSVEDMAALLAEHYEGDELDVRTNPSGSPHDCGARRTCSADTIEAYVCDFKENPYLTTMWVAEGRPCTQFWLPVFPLAHVPEVLDVMESPAAELARHLEVDPEAIWYTGKGWQRFQDYGNRLEFVYGNLYSRVKAQQQKLFSEARACAEAKVASVAQSIDCEREAGLRVLAEASEAMIGKALDTMQELESLFLKAKVLAPALLDIPVEGILTLQFSTPDAPVEETLRLGSAHYSNHEQYAQAVPGSLKQLDARTFEAQFPVAPLRKYIQTGVHRCFLGGQDGTENGFVADMVIRL